MKILLAGATGFVGKPLVTTLLSQGHDLIVLSRNPQSSILPNSVRMHSWKEFESLTKKNSSLLNGLDAVINLSGEAIAGKRWSPEQKKKLRSSRLETTQLIVKEIKTVAEPPKVFINASAVGYYGSVPVGDVSEAHASGLGFLANLCQEWEETAMQADSKQTRVVLPRIGIVLEQGGGALAKMIPPFLFFAGGPLGNGKQYFPWIHREDLIRSIYFALEQESLRGAYNAVAPGCITMKAFAQALGKRLRRPSLAPAPTFILKLLLGEMSEMLLTGQKAVPEKLLTKGFSFKYPDVTSALQAIQTDTI